MEYLYHYTKLDTCIKIILSGTILFNKLKDMNDINELYRPLFFKDTDDIDKKFDIENDYQQLSFTINGRKKGFDIPAMWGHYGDKGNGVCLVFNKEHLLNNLPTEVKQNGEICYTDDYSPDILIDNDKDKQPISSEKLKEVFFKKTSDWSYEQEYRIIAYSPNNENRLKLDISNSLVAIITHNFINLKRGDNFTASPYYNMLAKLFPKKKILNYNMFLDERILTNYAGDSFWSTVDWEHINIDDHSL